VQRQLVLADLKEVTLQVETVTDCHPVPRSTLTERQKWAAVAALSFAMAVSVLDRSIVNLLLDPIKHSFGLNDTQLGVMSGSLFALFYSTFNILFGALADRLNRRSIVLSGIISWTLLTALSGLSRSFTQLALGRGGLAIGEATLSPSAYSLISEQSSTKLGKPISVFFAGAMIGPALAMLYGAAMFRIFARLPMLSLPLYGPLEVWQAVLISASVPGFLAALAIRLWVTEPRKQFPQSNCAHEPFLAKTVEGFRLLWRNRRAYAPLIVSVTLVSIHTNGMLAWAPTYLSRSFGWAPGEVGVALGIILLVAGAGGSFFGGVCADRGGARTSLGRMLRIMLTMFSFAWSFAMTTMFNWGPWVGLAVISGYIFCAMSAMAVASTTLMSMTPAAFRGQVAGLYLVIIGLGAVATGPVLVGLLNDRLFGGNVGKSLASLAVCTIPVAIFVLSRGRSSRVHPCKEGTPLLD
jgi:MFS family permease